ncbi:UNVERIFIED_CONTAM: hypothetical protein Sradi_1738100 [Sesamum radiatum]|uniref:Uncharacterized protein n=1 Tax=Sesamum radiatum TaxID=300843 RepID=A0AAW2TUV9_SESRA
MGNCIETCREGPEKEMNPHPNSERTRIKIVLTRHELEQLLFQLNSSEGKRQLQDVLVEIQTTREKAAAWRPCLDTIIECPQVPEIMET